MQITERHGINMRRTKRKNVKGAALAVTAFTTLFLTGCGGQTLEETWKEAHTSTEQSDYIAEESAGNGSNTVETGATGASDDSDQQALYQGTYRSCIIQEDAEYFYLCGPYRVSKVSKETGSVETLWENEEQVDCRAEYLYNDGSGLLLGDKLYFIERWFEVDDSSYRALSCVLTDGSGYERIAELGTSYSDGMLLQDGTLYLDSDDKELWYQVYADGTLSGQDILLAENKEQFTYKNNGVSVVFHEEQITVPEGYDLASLNDNYMLISDYVTGEGLLLTLIDRNTLEEQELGTIEGSVNVVSMDDDYVYLLHTVYEKNMMTYIYERMALENGERSVLFTQEKSGFEKYVSSFLMDVVVREDYLYYVDEQDGKYYLMRRNVNEPEQSERVSDVFYDNGVEVIGSVQTLYEELYNENISESPVYRLDMEWLQVDEKYPGANAINTYIEDYLDAQREYVDNSVEEMEEWFEPGGVGVASELSSEFVGFDYYDSRYISYVQAIYDYQTGAAHGMPYWSGFTFDLQTGERLLLPDIIGNSQEELKEIVTAYFTQKINRNPENFWDDAIDYVNEYTSYESEFYLTRQGIVFYYGPYELACYAAGFQSVTIPYEEFEMKITLEKALKTEKTTLE